MLLVQREGINSSPLTGAYRGREDFMANDETKKLKAGINRTVRDLIIKGILIIVFILALFVVFFGIIIAPDPSMEPAVKSGDVIMFYRLDKNYVLHDLVVVSHDDNKQIRRVVAKGGDEVDIADGNLIVNGALQQEKNIITPTERYETGIEFPLTVPSGYIFVLNDDRNFGTDSRTYGTVAVEDTFGKAMTLLRIRGI